MRGVIYLSIKDFRIAHRVAAGRAGNECPFYPQYPSYPQAESCRITLAGGDFPSLPAARFGRLAVRTSRPRAGAAAIRRDLRWSIPRDEWPSRGLTSFASTVPRRATTGPGRRGAGHRRGPLPPVSWKLRGSRPARRLETIPVILVIHRHFALPRIESAVHIAISRSGAAARKRTKASECRHRGCGGCPSGRKPWKQWWGSRERSARRRGNPSPNPLFPESGGTGAFGRRNRKGTFRSLLRLDPKSRNQLELALTGARLGTDRGRKTPAGTRSGAGGNTGPVFVLGRRDPPRRAVGPIATGLDAAPSPPLSQTAAIPRPHSGTQRCVSPSFAPDCWIHVGFDLSDSPDSRSACP